MEKILVSKCLAGFNCRYDGGNNLVPEIKQLFDSGLSVSVCPEQLGGLPTPRIPSERIGGRVVNREGADVTDEFKAAAILKSRSPSCGKGCIYNGQFTGELVPGNGVTTDLLLHHGIEVLTEEEYLTRLTEG